MERIDIKKYVRKPDVRGLISLLGRSLITVGLILLLFVAYQLWGTSIAERRAQNELREEYNTKFEKQKNSTSTTTQPNQDDPTLEPSEDELAQFNSETVRGEPLGIIKIPKIGLDHVVISGTDRNSLQKGPGHYPNTPLPGQLGNSAIAGHRTTYGSPFARLDELKVGDDIVIETLRGTFVYQMSEPQMIVAPGDVSVIDPQQDLEADPSGATLLPEITLTTCHPKFSAAKRLVVTATLVEDPDYQPVEAVQLRDGDGKIPNDIDLQNDEILGDSDSQKNILVEMAVQSFSVPLFWWFLLMSTVGGIWWYLFKRYHNWKVWAAGVLPFAAVLLMYFINLEKALPVGI